MAGIIGGALGLLAFYLCVYGAGVLKRKMRERKEEKEYYAKKEQEQKNNN